MIRLEKHDEIVEAMARAIHEQHDVGPWDKSPAWQKIWRADAIAALNAMLEAVRIQALEKYRNEVLDEAYAAALNIKEMPLEEEGDAMLAAIQALKTPAPPPAP